MTDNTIETAEGKEIVLSASLSKRAADLIRLGEHVQASIAILQSAYENNNARFWESVFQAHDLDPAWHYGLNLDRNTGKAVVFPTIPRYREEDVLPNETENENVAD